MTTFYKLDFNSILDSHLAAKNGNPGTPLTRDNGTAQSLPGTSINAYSFFATLFGTGIGHYSNMSTFHIIYNLNAAHYVFHYNQISNYSDNFLSGSFTSGRYCLIMQTGSGRNAFYDYFKNNNAIKDNNYDFAVSSRWGDFISFVRTHSYAFSFEDQTNPGNGDSEGYGYTDQQYWGFKDFKILAKTENGTKISEIFFMVGNNKILQFPIDNSNHFNINNDRYWETINEEDYNNSISGTIPSSVPSIYHISSIKEVFSNDGAFCALKNDGTIKCWGHADYGGTTPVDISNVKTVYTSNQTFSALTNNNTIITWGKTEHGGGTTKVSNKMKKNALLNRMYGTSTSIHNVKKNNLRQKNNYNFNNSSYNRPLKQSISNDDEQFIETYSQAKLEKINAIKTLTNGEITENNLNNINIKNDKERHIVLDKIFSNITDVSFNINPLVIGLKDKLTKNKTKVFKSQGTINAKTDATSDILTTQAVYSNLSDLSDNVTVDMDDSVSFKVTRTTSKGFTGKYNVEVLSGKMVVYGRYSGTIEIGTALLKLGEYQDGDQIIINTHSFFFGGFGCNNLTSIANSDKNYQNVVIVGASDSAGAVAYLDSNGKVHCFGRGDFSTTGKNLDSGVIKLCSTKKCFIALKDDGTVVIWGMNGKILNKKLYFKHYSEKQGNDLYYNYSQQLNDIIDIQSFTHYKNFCILRKKNNSFILLGDGLSGGTSVSDSLLDENGNPPIKGVIFENIHQLYIGATDYTNKGYITIIGINNQGKVVTIGETYYYFTTKNLTLAESSNNMSAVNIESKYYGINGEILTTGSHPNYNGNFYQNYTVDNLPPVSKVFINGSFATAILNNGTAAWWGITYVYGPRSGTYEKDNTNIVTTSIFDKLRSRKFVDGMTSTSSTALLDSSGGVILFGTGNGSAHPTDIFVDTTNELKNDISANVIKMAATRKESFVFLRNDNTAILVPNVNTDISYNLFPNSYIDSITKKGPAISTKKQTYLIPNIKDVYTGTYAGFGFITTTNDVILWSYKEIRTFIDIGQTVGGKLENVKELFSNGNSWCALKYDNTLVCIKGGKESINNKIGFIEVMLLAGCDYNDIYFGINGIYSNGGNGKGGCVLNGDGSETTLKNVKNVFPVYCVVGDVKSSTDVTYGGGYVAIIDDGIKETIVYWGNSKISYKYYKMNVLYSDTKNDGMSLVDMSNNLINKTSSNNIFGIQDTETYLTWGKPQIMKNNKYKYPNKYNFGNSIVIKVTVQNIGGNKFVLNGDTSSYTFKDGYSYIFDTTDSSNTNYKIAVSNSPDISKNENCVQYLTPGETHSFMRYYKSNKYTYIYCETNGFDMGSLYNPTTPTEFTAIETAFGGATEKNIVSKYVNVPVNKKLLDVSLNNITMNTDAKKSAILESLFTTLPTNSLIINKDKLGYEISNIGINNPLVYGINMKVINTTKELRGMSISGETVLSSAVAFNKVLFNDSLYVNMKDLSDNILLNAGDKIGAPYSSTTGDLPTIIRGIEFTIRRITASSSDARYDISSNFGTLNVNTSASNFNTTDNTGYFVNNDKAEIEGTEIIFHTSGFITKGNKKTYTNIIVTVNSDSKFLFNNSTTKPIFEYDKNYKFDVSDSSNENYKLRFSNANSTNVYNSIGYGTPGTSGSFVTFTPGNFTAQSVYVFDSSNNDLNIGSLYNPMPVNNGISKANLDSIETQVINGGITLPGTLYSGLIGSNDEEKQNQKNLRRHQMLRTVFAVNPANTTLETTTANLGFGSEYIKTNFKVFNPLNDTKTVNISLTNDTTNTKGFYAGLEDNTTANITLSDGVTVLKVERTSTDSNNCGVYYVSNTTNSSELFVTETNSKTYDIESNPAGPFKDNDTATINYMPLVFGGIGDGRNTNPTLNPSAPTLTPIYNTEPKISVMVGNSTNSDGQLGGFAGIANDGKLYKWGVSETSLLEPGNSAGDSPSGSRITNISFCTWVGRDFLFIKADGSIGNTSTRTTDWQLNNVRNKWYDNGTFKTDLSTISDVERIYRIQLQNQDQVGALLLRTDGSIAFWNHTNQGDSFYNLNYTYHGIDEENYSLTGSYGKRLMDSTDSNFSRIIKIVGGRLSMLLLRADGRIAWLRFHHNNSGRLSTTLPLYEDEIRWNQGGSQINELTLSNSLDDDGTFKTFLGNVKDIVVVGNDSLNNTPKFRLLTELGQCIALHTQNRHAPNYYTSYDTTHASFTKTVKMFAFKGVFLQIMEDGKGYIPKEVYDYNNGGHNSTDQVDVLDGAELFNNSGVKIYRASASDGYVSKFYGTYVLMSNGSLHVSRILRSGNPNWNDPATGIYGTGNGYPVGTPPYGELNNVKSLHVSHIAWAALLDDGKVVTWGHNFIGNTYDISNQLVNVKRVLLNDEHAGAALKNDGSLVVWGNTTRGGSTTGYASTPNMSDTSFSSGILDIHCSSHSFTAVKKDGILLWGKIKPSAQLTSLNGVNWDISKTIIMDTVLENESGIYWPVLANSYGPNKTLGKFLYNTTTAITSKINELLTEGVSQVDINSITEYPEYYKTYDSLTIPSTLFSSGTKDTIRKLLIELLFLLRPRLSKIENMKPVSFSLDTKINKDNFTIFKSNMGAIDLSAFNNYYDGYYSPMVDTNMVNFKNIDGNVFFQIEKRGDNYVLEKQDGIGVISANNLGPFTSGKLEINGSIIKFFDGVYDGTDRVVQKFNCIATTQYSAAYLTKTGKVITWGRGDNGGYSHEEFSLQTSTPHNSISSHQINVSTDAKLKIIEIISTINAFAALKADGSVVSWGYTYYGGKQNQNNSNIESQLTSGVKKLYSNLYAFCAVKNDGTIVCWGHQTYGGNSALNNSGGEQKDIVKIFPHTYGFIGLKSDKSIVTWGNIESKIDHVNYGVNGSYNNNTTALTTLTNILEVYINSFKKIYIAIKTDGSIVRWGYNTNTYMSTDLQNRFKKEGIYTNAPPFVNAYSSGDGIYPVDASGGVYVISDVNANYTQWDVVKTDISENVTRVVTNGTADSAYGVIACLTTNNLIVFGTRGSHKSYGGDFDSTDTTVTNYAHLPPSEYIVNDNTLKNIKDIFPGETGFAAIDISDNVICWGYKNADYVNNIDYTKIYGGDLSGNDISKNRPIALFNNGRSWACLKEDETVITWDGTNTTNTTRGSKHIDTTYGVNATYWGGNNNGGAIRNGDGTNNTLDNIKNIIPYGYNNYCGFIAIGEDISSNNFCVAWGSDDDTSRWKSATPDINGRAFRHIVDKLTSHSKYQLGIFNNRGNFDIFRNTAHENLHEFDFGNQEFTGNETGFGSPVTQEETYDVEAIDSDASANGVPTETITKFKNSKLNEDVDETEVFATESSIFNNTIDTTKTVKEVRKQRKNILKLAFANNPKRTKFKTTAASLGYTKLAKTNIMVVKINFGKAEINLKEDKNLDDNTGFLIPIEDGQEATITNKEGNSKFTITRDDVSFADGDGKYYVETIEQVSMITNFESSTYIRGSSPQGPFKDGDRAVIAGVPILFGGLTEDDGNYSFGDPYINPVFGSVTKLPDKKEMYRLFQGLGVYINCSVDKISDKKQKFMEDWFYKKTGFDSKLFGFVTSGYFYNKIYIASENHELLCDFDKQSMTMDEKDQEYFTIANTYGIEKDNKFILNEKCSIYTISWPHKEYNNIDFTIKIYENPQIDNAVSIQVAGNIIDCKGLLVRNYKPSLMRISDIKIKKDKKLNKRLKKAKHKFATKAIKDGNEVWVKIKGT